MEEYSGKNLLKDVFIGKTLRVFISYSEKDALIAGGVKRTLKHYGIEAFLAHEDIPPGEEWEKHILRIIKTADIFLPILSQNFKESDWADQETGIAISNSILIIPICIEEILPYGFMKKYQAFKRFKYKVFGTGDEKSIFCDEDIFKIISFLTERKELKDNMKDCLITSLEYAGSFRFAEEIMDLLMKFEPFSKSQANEIIKNSLLNNQVYKANGCRSKLREFLDQYGVLIKEENRKSIEELIN